MPTARASGRWPGLPLLGLVGLLVLPGLVACGADRSEPVTPLPSAAPTTTTTSPSAPQGNAGQVPPVEPGATPTVVVPRDIPRVLQQVLDVRASAVLGGDRAGFLASLEAPRAVRRTEARYFDNLAQLPVTRFGHRLLRESLVRVDEGYWAVVESSLRLGPFDQRAVRTLDRFLFVPVAGGFRIASTTDARWEAEHVGVREPWETTAITAVQGAGVLGVFDDATAPRARQLVASVEAGVADLAGRVPYDWSRTVAFYALSDTTFLEGFDQLPGGDPQALDAIAFTVPAGPDDDAVASVRFALNPRGLDAVGPRRSAALDRLVRHELAHLAVGTHDDEAPLWLSEGIAEWASVQALPRRERRVTAATLAAARAGRLRLPADDAFNGADATDHYALAWWVCEWIVRTHGEDDLWTFLGWFTVLADRDDAAVVREILGMSVDDLAARGSALMVRTYEPEVMQPTETVPPPGSADPASPSGP